MSAELTYNQIINENTQGLRDDYTTGLATTLTTNVDATISSRASAADLATAQADLTSILAAVVPEVADILADTAAIDARLPSDPADASVVDGQITAAKVSVKGASDKDLTQVYDLINTSSNPFRQTTFETVSGSVTAYVAATWTDIYASGALALDTEITGILIDNTGGSPVADVYRVTLTDGSTKIFPYGASQDVRDNKIDELQFPVRVPAGAGFKVQVNCTTTNSASAQLVELDVIRHG